jgi:hypothetical protein
MYLCEVDSMKVDVGVRKQPAIFAQILGAEGPNPEYADKLMLFGQFVGSWDVESRRPTPDGTTRVLRGEWHFFWALEGRAIQDVIISPPIGERDPRKWRMGDYQTAVRFYRPESDTWDVTAISPPFNQVHRLVARKVGQRIVLEGTTPDGTPERWSFNDITPDRLRWRGELSRDGGRTWIVDEEMTLTRRA